MSQKPFWAITPCAPLRLRREKYLCRARKFVPRYPLVAATLIGRLAIAQQRQGEGLGTLLLADALRRAYTSAAVVGSSMIVVDAISEQAAAFYEATGFIRLPDSLRLVLPTATIARLL